MGKLIISQHVSIDGYMAGPNGEMNWINFNDELFDFVGTLTHTADTALYGRKTFEMMDAYWPAAGRQENAGKHEREHSAWYNRVNKIVFSNTMLGKDRDKVRFINDSMMDVIKNATQQSNVLLFGSPGALQSLFAHDMVDEMYLFINPVLLGKGIPLFSGGGKAQQWQLQEIKPFASCNVAGMHYRRAQ